MSKPVTRRFLLRGAGAAMSLPWLESIATAAPAKDTGKLDAPLFGSSLKDGNRHDPENLPLILAGRGKGTIRTGRRLRAPEKTPLCNLYLSMLDRMGIREASFGDSTGPLQGLA